MGEQHDKLARKSVLMAEIEAAFGDVRLEDGLSLSQARAIDNYDDPKVEMSDLDTDLRWQDIPDEKLERLGDTLAFLDPKGLRFYLPRFMVYSLIHEGRPGDTGIAESARNFSDPRDTTGRHRMFSTQQMSVLMAFTDYFFPPADRDD